MPDYSNGMIWQRRIWELDPQFSNICKLCHLQGWKKHVFILFFFLNFLGPGNVDISVNRNVIPVVGLYLLNVQQGLESPLHREWVIAMVSRDKRSLKFDCPFSFLPPPPPPKLFFFPKFPLHFPKSLNVFGTSFLLCSPFYLELKSCAS